MQLLTTSLPPDHEIGFAACLHFGNEHQHLSGIKSYVDWLMGGKNRFGAILGDIGEAISSTDKRYEPDIHKQAIVDQYNDAVDIFWPARMKLLFALSGNHDWKLSRYGDFVQGIFCKRLGTPYGTYSCKLAVSNGNAKTKYKIFATHGNGTVRSQHADPIMREAAERWQVKRKLAAERMADCLVNAVAHFHKAIVVPPFQDLYLVDDGNKIKQQYIAEADPTAKFIPPDLRWYMAVPGFVKKYGTSSGYVERAGLPPVELGFMVAHVENGKVQYVHKMLV